MFSNKMRFHFQACWCLCGSYQLKCFLVCLKRLPRPILGNLTEKTMFDWIPFGRSRRIMADCYRKAVLVAQFCLESIFPYTRPCTIAASTVSKDIQFLRIRIAIQPFFFPPFSNRIHSKCRGIACGAQIYRPQVSYCIGSSRRILVKKLWLSICYGQFCAIYVATKHISDRQFFSWHTCWDVHIW